MRYLAGRRRTAIARIVRPARHSSSAPAAIDPSTVIDTPPSAGSRHAPADTRSTRTRSAAPASVGVGVRHQPAFDLQRSVVPLEIERFDRESAEAILEKLPSGGCIARCSAALPINVHTGTNPSVTHQRATPSQPASRGDERGQREERHGPLRRRDRGRIEKHTGGDAGGAWRMRGGVKSTCPGRCKRRGDGNQAERRVIVRARRRNCLRIAPQASQ